MDIKTKIIELFEKNNTNESYSLFDASHPLKIYLGTNYEGQKSLVAISNSDQVEVFSSKYINAKYERRDDESLSLSFSLRDASYLEIFYNFCDDIIRNTYDAQESDGFGPIVDRYEAWQNFFKKENPFMSESEIKGLIGELLFIEKYMIPTYGPDRTIDSYIGIENEHKDFELGDTWHEIKTTHYGANSISISSLEQLSSDRIGHLEVIVLDAGARSDESINLNKMVERVRGMLGGNSLRQFNNLLLDKGYSTDDYYESYSYIPISATRYEVTSDFPKLTREVVPDGVVSAKYELDLLAIKEYEESKWI